MRVYRLGAVPFTRTRKAAFSGEGGLQASARWHTAGHLIVYTAQSLSLPALVILVHLKQTNNIQPFCAYSAEIPDALSPKPDPLPPRWRSRMAVSRRFGDTCLHANTSSALLLPSVIPPGEPKSLLN